MNNFEQTEYEKFEGFINYLKKETTNTMFSTIIVEKIIPPFKGVYYELPIKVKNGKFINK
jgi:hypothetical protein